MFSAVLVLHVECQSSKAFQVIQKVLYRTAKSHIVLGLPTGREFLVFQKQLLHARSHTDHGNVPRWANPTRWTQIPGDGAT